MVYSWDAMGEVQVNGEQFKTAISSNPKVAERLSGLLFFRQFEYVIPDYKERSIYVSNMRM
jgi:hypothetical protein